MTSVRAQISFQLASQQLNLGEGREVSYIMFRTNTSGPKRRDVTNTTSQRAQTKSAWKGTSGYWRRGVTNTVSLHASNANQKKWLKYHERAPSQCAAVESVRLKKTISVKGRITMHEKCFPFHILVYQFECNIRAKMADQLVHSELHHGHSNWLEASHNVLLRFRQKHLSLERLHYHIATNLSLLQAILTDGFSQQGAVYHWKPELFQPSCL